MNADELEREIRATLQQNVQDITGASLSRPDLPATRRSRTLGARRWVAPALVAAAFVVITGIVTSLSAAHRHVDNSVMSAGGSLSGSWQLSSASTGGRPVAVSSNWVITLVVHSDDTILIDDGVNTTTLTGHGADGALWAKFRSITYVLDPREGTAHGKALLQILDSIAPNSKPNTQTRSKYQIADGELRIHTSTGDLVFRQVAAPSTGTPSRTASTTGS